MEAEKEKWKMSLLKSFNQRENQANEDIVEEIPIRNHNLETILEESSRAEAETTDALMGNLELGNETSACEYRGNDHIHVENDLVQLIRIQDVTLEGTKGENEVENGGIKTENSNNEVFGMGLKKVRMENGSSMTIQKEIVSNEKRIRKNPQSLENSQGAFCLQYELLPIRNSSSKHSKTRESSEKNSKAKNNSGELEEDDNLKLLTPVRRSIRIQEKSKRKGSSEKRRRPNQFRNESALSGFLIEGRNSECPNSRERKLQIHHERLSGD